MPPKIFVLLQGNSCELQFTKVSFRNLVFQHTTLCSVIRTVAFLVFMQLYVAVRSCIGNVLILSSSYRSNLRRTKN